MQEDTRFNEHLAQHKTQYPTAREVFADGPIIQVPHTMHTPMMVDHAVPEVLSDELDAFIEQYTKVSITSSTDMVHAPNHYKLPGLPHEWIDVRSALLKTIPPGINYEVVTCWSEAITYLARCWGKNGFEDIAKAKVYLDRLLELPSENQHGR